ncbi:translation initiation factor eIF2B subunit epsilon [Parasteatoda tepidariorum]|uniref:translation initiation factor eIF2B subunit epsilon n=1 Tax=Parasteatoda tepidariorum TaxID=114398 RepID=UPI00077F9315|nr:translation initiation factor eIF-2B subunit epsilon [Parasteatoda tepidariorum]
MSKNELKRQEINQAVIVADSFNRKLAPLTNLKPEVLLPVANGVVLDFILQSLEESGIQETFIFCCANNHLVRSYVNSSRWSEDDSKMSVQVISSTCFLSMGDIMRELDSKGLIRSDFLLINGDVITNFPLGKILEEHKNRRQTDKNSAITLVYRKALPNHANRCKENNFVVAVESDSNRIRYFQRINKMRTVHFPLEIFQESEEISIHNDLLDSSISICSPCVPPLFSDNFDYQTMDDFVKGLLVNEELLGNSMYIHISKTGYGSNISNLCMYDSISQDIMARWTYPLVPDLLKLNGSKYSFTRQNVYKEPDVEIGRNCEVQKNVILGSGTKIDENTFISNSVIGRNCTIGKNVVVKGSYLWDNIVIKDNCILDTCLLADTVILNSNVNIQPGCVLGSEVVIGEGVTLPPCTKLQSQVYTEDDSFGEEDFEEETKANDNKVCDKKLVGEKGHGYLCQSESDSDMEEDDDIVEDIWGKTEEFEPEDDDDSISSSSEIPSLDDVAAEESDGEIDKYEDDEDTMFFYKEVFESLQRGIEENIKSENLILEINSSKHAYNVTMKEVTTLVVSALLRLPVEDQKDSMTSQQYLNAMKTNLNFFKPLISNYVKSAESQNDCLASLVEFTEKYKHLAPAAVKVMHFWYDQDILSEPVIVKWYDSLTPEQEAIKIPASAFIQWLKTADEESDED